MKYIAIVFLYFIGCLNTVSALRIVTDKPTAEEGASAEADLDALMDKYDDKEKSDKDAKDGKAKKQATISTDPNAPTKEMVQD